MYWDSNKNEFLIFYVLFTSRWKHGFRTNGWSLNVARRRVSGWKKGCIYHRWENSPFCLLYIFPLVRDPLFCAENCIMSKTVVFLMCTEQVYRFYSSIYFKPALATEIMLSTYFQVKNWPERATEAYSCWLSSQHGGLGISNFRFIITEIIRPIAGMMWTENNWFWKGWKGGHIQINGHSWCACS